MIKSTTSPTSSELAPCDSADGFDDPELLALGHAILVKQCELGSGCPLEIWPETPILPKLLFSWRRLPM